MTESCKLPIILLIIRANCLVCHSVLLSLNVELDVILTAVSIDAVKAP